MQKIYIIAAEKSADQHVASLLHELRLFHSNLNVRAIGGEALKAAGAEIFMDYRHINYMGVWEVIKNIRGINLKIKQISVDIKKFDPSVIIHVDAAGLNMKIASISNNSGAKRLYYIAPKVWAWNTSRVFKLKALFDKLFVIFPFEKRFYDSYNVPVSYAGNPTFESVNKYQLDNSVKNYDSNSKYIALLPGSRLQEIEKSLVVYTEVVKRMPEMKFKVAAISQLPTSLYKCIGLPNVEIVYENYYDLLANAYIAVVVSGTATLETALFNIPQVVCYKTSWLTALMGKIVLKIPYISLVNLVAEKKVVQELVQRNFNASNLYSEINNLIGSIDQRSAMLNEYEIIRERLSSPNASKVAAKEIAVYLGWI